MTKTTDQILLENVQGIKGQISILRSEIENLDRRLTQLEGADPPPPVSDWKTIFEWRAGDISPSYWHASIKRGDKRYWAPRTGLFDFPPNYVIPSMNGAGELVSVVTPDAPNQHCQLRVVGSSYTDGVYYLAGRRYRETMECYLDPTSWDNANWTVLMDHLSSGNHNSTPAIYAYGGAGTRKDKFRYYVQGSANTGHSTAQTSMSTEEPLILGHQIFVVEVVPSSDPAIGKTRFERNGVVVVEEYIGQNTHLQTVKPNQIYPKFGLYSSSKVGQKMLIRSIKVETYVGDQQV